VLARTSVALFVLLLGYSISVAVRTGLADAYAEPAKSFLQAKRSAREVLTPDEWQAIYEALSQALVLAPGDPENMSELGRLHRILLEADDLDAEQILRYGDAAAGYYQAALAQRPTWPWDWGDLARVKYEQYQDAGSVYQQALARAVEFGPREALLHDLVAELGMDSWSLLSPAVALAVLTAADRALERNPGSLSWMLDEKARWQPVCARTGDSFAHLKRRCEMLGLT